VPASSWVACRDQLVMSFPTVYVLLMDLMAQMRDTLVPKALEPDTHGEVKRVYEAYQAWRQMIKHKEVHMDLAAFQSVCKIVSAFGVYATVTGGNGGRRLTSS